MSADLHDYRGRITPETHCVLEAVSRRTGRDRQEIVRELLHEWATKHISDLEHDASLIDRLLRAEGLSGIGGGMAGNARERQG